MQTIRIELEHEADFLRAAKKTSFIPNETGRDNRFITYSAKANDPSLFFSLGEKFMLEKVATANGGF